jgi:hypothetical protein
MLEINLADISETATSARATSNPNQLHGRMAAALLAKSGTGSRPD